MPWGRPLANSIDIMSTSDDRHHVYRCQGQEATGTSAVCKPRLPSIIVIGSRSIIVTTLSVQSRSKRDRRKCLAGSARMDSRAGSAADGTKPLSPGTGRCCDRPGQPDGGFPKLASHYTDRAMSPSRPRKSRVGLHIGCSGGIGPLWACASVLAEHPTNVREDRCP